MSPVVGATIYGSYLNANYYYLLINYLDKNMIYKENTTIATETTETNRKKRRKKNE